MVLKFTKDVEGNILLTLDSKPFDNTDYFKMVKAIQEGNEIKLDNFDENITLEEQQSIKDMIKRINDIKFDDEVSEQPIPTNEDDLPF